METVASENKTSEEWIFCFCEYFVLVKTAVEKNEFILTTGSKE